MIYLIQTLGLFTLTAVAEIVGCYLPYLWLKKGASAWLLLPAALSLALLAWLLTLHPTAAGRIYAAYGGVHVSVAILWLWLVDAVRPTAWDIAGVLICLTGMAVIMLGPTQARAGPARDCPNRSVTSTEERIIIAPWRKNVRGA